MVVKLAQSLDGLKRYVTMNLELNGQGGEQFDEKTTPFFCSDSCCSY